MDACKADLLATTNLGDVLPYLQHLPADKLDSAVFLPALWAISEADVDKAIAATEEAFRMGEAPEDLLPSCKKRMKTTLVLFY
jgi:hypothetical protein